jgi:hypothetical protein
MTDQQINEAIARACGWQSFEETNGDPWLWARTKPDGTVESTMEPLPYCTDLNAMHNAEQHLWRRNYYLRYDYIYDLGTLLNSHNPQRMEANDMLDATARQRAEAFLRTLGKWEEAAK